MSSASQEITLKDFIYQTRSWFRYILSKWLIIVIIAACVAGLGILYAVKSDPEYTASVTFVLSTNSGSSNSLLGLASQFGLDLRSGTEDVFAGDNIIALMKSRRMVQETLMKKPADGKTTLLNILVKEMEMDEAWSNDDRLKNAFPFPDTRNHMTLVQDSLFREVYYMVVDNMLDISKPEKSQSIYAATTISTNETFSFYFTRNLVDATSAFYIKTKTSTARQNLDMLQREADSLRNILGNAITTIGAETDKTFNLNPAFQVQRSGIQQNQVRASALGTAYGEVLKNLEIAKISLQKETPLYQVIDEPVLPLKMSRASVIIFFIIGGMIGGFMMVLYLTVKRFFKNI
ncbi:lipopolysaccharide biosynthesis protein [Panacibacter sp. DH6]|uniref:Lipopolysaccharide biosynthesis protein n=1 Tax=Panacibacter microcysteis TaxID=2793269 RepID=A0A931E646_9BACT|nr:Wzz/FepE/Etk N-terminal domain-containing protein [Panacibacter microcysteis]MBG9375743.1 lipopolysaccharide biosynthesis protein [Panacibacter microcysteis]